MKLKLNDDGSAVVKDGMPVYLYDDGKEVPFDAPAAMSKITSLNGESRGHRERAESAEKGLKAFEGITDAVAAKKAIETLKNFDDKKLVDAGEVERIKSETIKAIESKYAPIVEENSKLTAAIHAEKIGGSFARSKFIAEKLNIPPDMVEARFGGNFKLVDGKVQALDATGNQIFSRTKPGEVADFDEALSTLVEQYPYRDNIMKASGASGGGASGGAGAGGGKTMSRQIFDSQSATEQAAFVRGGGAITD